MSLDQLLGLIRPAVRAESAYHVGAVAGTSVKLNQNESPYDVPEDLKRELVARFLEIPFNRYPSERAERLHDALAAYTGWDREGLMLGNGSNELMYTLGQVFVGRGTPVVLPRPMFALYEKIVRLQEGRVIAVAPRPDLSFDTEGLLDAIRRENPTLVIVTSPNNPTGIAMRFTEIRALIEAAPGFVLVDEAYLDFNDEPSVLSLVQEHPQVIVLRTFSKAFGLAGLRLGYLLGAPEVMREIGKARVPFMVDGLTEATAMALLGRPDLLRERAEELKGARATLQQNLAAIPGVQVIPSQANFVLFRTRHDVNHVLSRLSQSGILVRNMAGYPELQGYIRVNAGTPDENKQFMDALSEIVQSPVAPARV